MSTPSTKKSSAEEELEKQYRDYKAQFDQWKEKNKSSIGTDAYDAYVKQFQEWEKDVEKRRKSLREKAEREANELRAQKEEEEKAKRIQEAKEAEAAAAYAQSQQAYIAHHQAALEQEHQRLQQQAAQLAAQVVVQQQPPFANPPQHVTQLTAQVPQGDLNAENVFKEMVNVVMGGAAAALGTTVTQQPPPSMPGAPGPAGPPPQLWGNTKVTYDMKDPLFLRWGARAAPAHNPPCIRPPMPVGPCWMLENALRENKLAVAPGPNLPPPIFIQPPPVI
uniref:Clathrin light chain n=1 Tax=Haemonchus contortus TaxID=6289 RepID=A0A7I4YTU0_HAECO